jgi:hypothetical protein
VSATGVGNMAIGKLTQVRGSNNLEIGIWQDSTTRFSALRVHGNGAGHVSASILDRSTKYSAGGAIGSENVGSLALDMYSMRRNGDDIYIDVNIGGTVKTFKFCTVV